MQIEVETMSLLMWAFFIVITLSLGVIFKLWLTSKEKAFIWFGAQIVFLFFAFLEFLYLIKLKPQVSNSMISEENSLALGITGVLWSMSMLCMLIGIWRLGKKPIKK